MIAGVALLATAVPAAAVLAIRAGAPAQEAAPATELVLTERRGTVMGTSMLIEVVAAPDFDAEAALDTAEAELRRVEDVMTDWRDSELMRLNARAGQGPVPVTKELAALVNRAVLVAELTGGAFDPTWKALEPLWDFKAEHPTLPDAAQLEAALERVDYRRVKVDLVKSTVELPEGFRIGLGGIAKGYGVDRAMDALRGQGVENGLVEAGGDLKALGKKTGESWKIAIRHPRDRERVLAVVPVSNRCVVTSGDYERFFELDGVRYHHILDPRTGRPSTGCMSATVVGPDAATCDALATALCVLPPEKGLKLIEQGPGYEALVVGLDGEVHVTEGLRSAATR